MAGLSLELYRPKTPCNRYRPRAKAARSTGFDRRVVKVVTSTIKSQPPTATLVKQMNTSLTYINSANKSSIPRPGPVTNDGGRPKPRVDMNRRPRPIAGQRHRPVVPIRPRCNSTLTSIVGFGEQFSSTTIVSGASQGEPTIIHGPLMEFKSPAENQYLGGQDVWNANSLSQSNEMMLDTLEVPVEALMSEDNEIQTIHIGDFSNVETSENPSPATEETFIASTDSSGKCVVTVQQPIAAKPADVRIGNRPVVGNGARNVRVRVVGYGRSRMIADYQTSIPVADFKAQLNDTSDIVGKMEVAPPTKRLMQLLNNKHNNNGTCKTEGAARLLANPARPIGSRLLGRFVRHLTTRRMTSEETFPDMELLPLGYTRTVDLSKIKRITRKRFYPEAEEYRRKLANEQLQLGFERFVAENDGMQGEGGFLQEEEEEILPDYHATDYGPLTNFDKEAHEEVMCLYGESATDEPTLMDANRSTIIMVHERQPSDDTSAFLPKNIEVLLAAAEKQGVSRKNIQQVIFCQPADGDEQQIVVMPIDPLTEELSDT